MCRMPPPAAPCTYAIGDLHGNALKLFAFLLWAGLIENDLVTMLKIYHINESYYNKNYLTFYNTIQSLRFNAQAVKNIKLIFIGDTLFDRGISDYMTLMLFELMANNNINFTIILSNHDLEFIRQMESGCWRNIFIDAWIEEHHSYDLNRLPIDQQQKAHAIYLSVYKPRLKIVDLDYDGVNLIVYSHAPCDIKTMQTLGKSNSCDIFDLANVININLDYFLNEFFNFPHQNNPLFEFIWNRDINKQFSGNVINVFGHICELKTTSFNQINLDTILGHPASTFPGYDGKLKVYEVPRLLSAPLLSAFS